MDEVLLTTRIAIFSTNKGVEIQCVQTKDSSSFHPAKHWIFREELRSKLSRPNSAEE